MYNIYIFRRDIAQSGSASVLGIESHRFESCYPESIYIYRSISTSLVQLVERRFPKSNVVGSSPTRRVNLFFFNFCQESDLN